MYFNRFATAPLLICNLVPFCVDPYLSLYGHIKGIMIEWVNLTLQGWLESSYLSIFINGVPNSMPEPGIHRYLLARMGFGIEIRRMP